MKRAAFPVAENRFLEQLCLDHRVPACLALTIGENITLFLATKSEKTI
jgi:hypothetical protein